MTIKIDLEKAYDKIKLDFFQETLNDFGRPSNILDLIWSCISTTRMRMLWNGEVLEEFSPRKGIRQGDPLSMYLFVLFLERLFHLINLAMVKKVWKPITFSRGDLSISTWIL